MTTKLFIYFVVLLNPFAQIIFLWDLMRALPVREFAKVYARASILSFSVFILFVLIGEFLFIHVFQVRIGALSIFGGIIILVLSFNYMLYGAKNNLLLQIHSEDLDQSISLPFLVGPGTIWLSVLIGKQTEWYIGIIGISIIVVVNWILVILIHSTMQNLKSKRVSLVGKYFGILMRTNALFIGSIAVEMIISGIQQTLLSASKNPIIAP